MSLLWEKLSLSKLKMKVTSNMVYVSGCTDEFFVSEVAQRKKRAFVCLMSTIKLVGVISRCFSLFMYFMLCISSGLVVISF